MMSKTVPRTWATTIPRTGLREMGTNGPWDWRLTVPKTIKMTLVRPPTTNLKMTVRADCAVSACSPLTVCKSSCPLIVTGGGVGVAVGLWTSDHLPPSIQNKANFPFHQPYLFIGFWEESNQTPLLVAVLLIKVSLRAWDCAALFANM